MKYCISILVIVFVLPFFSYKENGKKTANAGAKHSNTVDSVAGESDSIPTLYYQKLFRLLKTRSYSQC